MWSIGRKQIKFYWTPVGFIKLLKKQPQALMSNTFTLDLITGVDYMFQLDRSVCIGTEEQTKHCLRVQARHINPPL